MEKCVVAVLNGKKATLPFDLGTAAAIKWCYFAMFYALHRVDSHLALLKKNRA